MIVDTHCHLHFPEFDADREEVIRRANESGVKAIINVGTDPATNEAAARIAGRHAGVFATAGLHPHYAHEISEEALEGMDGFVKKNRPVAIGEIGLDYFKSEADPAIQKKVFVRMLRLARENGLPVIVHSRNAFRDTLEVLKAEGKGALRGVMHCFSYDASSLRELLDIGFLASFTCNLTFKNAAALLEVAKAAPLDRIMLETDAPYMAPQIHRGKRNEPAYLASLADFLSEKRGIARAELEDATTRTALKFFGLPVTHA
jgi:TatD DNase family protein